MVSFQHKVEYFFYKILTTLIAALPVHTLFFLAKTAAFANLYVIRYRNDVVYNQMKKNVDGISNNKKKVLLSFYVKQFFIFLDMVKTWHLNSGNIHSRMNEIKIINMDKKDLAKERGLILSSHLSNFIYGSRVVHHCFHPLSAVIRTQKNKLIHDDYYRCLTKGGQALLDFRKDLKKIFYFKIPDNHWLGLLLDQDAGKKGVHVPFMKNEASCFPGGALLIQKYDVPVYLIYMRTDRNLKYTVYIEKIEFDDKSDKYEIMKRVNEKIGNFIAENPEDWFWFHRRWKTKKKV